MEKVIDLNEAKIHAMKMAKNFGYFSPEYFDKIPQYISRYAKLTYPQNLKIEVDNSSAKETSMIETVIINSLNSNKNDEMIVKSLGILESMEQGSTGKDMAENEDIAALSVEEKINIAYLSSGISRNGLDFAKEVFESVKDINERVDSWFPGVIKFEEKEFDKFDSDLVVNNYKIIGLDNDIRNIENYNAEQGEE